MAFAGFFSRGKTFRPKKKFEEGSLKHQLHKKAEASLNAGLDLRRAVELPAGERMDDWIAVHVVDFFNRINLIYGTICDACTPASCPVMSGGPKYEYKWADGENFRKPTSLPAHEYITHLMEWIEKQINNEDVFPSDPGVPFPKLYHPVCKKILTRLFRVFVHVYIHHFDKIVSIGAEAHVNTCYKHFYFFIRNFKLVDPRELEPLREMSERICK
eukprot:m.25097 g.25097  ORF g.25097 m.25097 type:complete len:215 (+) comp28736_c0_seq1:32-676(+)